MNDKETIKTSKFLSLILRREPVRVGLSLDDAGWIGVDELLRAVNQHGISLTLDQLKAKMSPPVLIDIKLARELGYRIESPNDKLPALVHGAGPRAAKCQVSIGESSQFASALLLCAEAGNWQVTVAGENAEESPYVAMTSKLIAAFPHGGGQFQVLLNHVRAARSHAFGIQPARHSFPWVGLADDPFAAGEPRQQRGADCALQVENRVVLTALQRCPQSLEFRSGLAAEGSLAPDFRGGKEQIIDQRLRRSLGGLAAIRRQQRPPARLDDPVDAPIGMSLPERGHRRKGVQDVAHRAQPNHQQAKVGVRLQALIFSQERVRRTARHAVAGFCLWGACFILGAASATR